MMDNRRTNHTNFAFVDYDKSRVPQNSNVRRLIRQHAMRDVAVTRRRKGNYGRRRPPQPLPSESRNRSYRDDADFEDDQEVGSSCQRTTLDKQTPARSRTIWWNQSNATRNAIALCQPLSDGTELAMTGLFPIFELIAPFTSLHLGIAKPSCLMAQPRNMSDVLNKPPIPHLQSRRLLSYIPSRYGKVPCITDTVDCLVARLKQIIRLNSLQLTDAASCEQESWVVLSHYAKALRTVQATIDDTNSRKDPETLCALKLLGVFELLSQNPDLTAWIYHAGGASKLIQLRGSDGFRTDFELALFMAHCGSIVTESFLSNRACFLAEEPWQRVINTAIRDDISIPADQSGLIHELWSHLVFGPEMLNTVTQLVCSTSPPSPSTIQTVIDRIWKDMNHLQMWGRLLQQRQSTDEDSSGENAAHSRRPDGVQVTLAQKLPWQLLQGTYTMCCMLKRRLLTSLAPNRFSYLEAEAQALAAIVIETSAESTSKAQSLPSGLFTAQTIWVAKAMAETKDIWSSSCESSGRGGDQDALNSGMIEKWKFRKWCKTTGIRST